MKNDISKTVAQLKEIRTEKKLSQTKFSSMLGMAAPTQLQNYEQGRTTPSIKKVEEWADALGYKIVLLPKDIEDTI